MQISPESIGIIVVGIVLCFAGWYLFRFSTHIIGFILGASIGYTLFTLALKILGKTLPVAWEPWAILGSAILFGLLGILFIKTAIKAVLFIAGFLFGMVVVSIYSGGVAGISHPYGIEFLINNLSIWSLASGLLFGILFILFEKGFIIVYTCAVGAYLITSQLGPKPMLFYGLLIIGGLVQFWMSKGVKVRNFQVTKSDAGI